MVGTSLLHNTSYLGEQTRATPCISNLFLSAIDDTWWGQIIEFVLFAYCFLGLAIICDEYLVVGLETLCVRFKLREDMAGATFMALGSAAPEIIVNAVSTMQSSSDATATNLGVGAIIGSGTVAFSLIPGCCALLTHHTLLLKRRPLLRDISFYGLALALLAFSMRDGVITLFESGMLLVVYVGYIFVIAVSPHVRRKYRIKFLNYQPIVRQRSFVEEQEEILLLSTSSDEVMSNINNSSNGGGYTLIESGAVNTTNQGQQETTDAEANLEQQDLGDEDDDDDGAVDLRGAATAGMSLASRTLSILTWPLRRVFSLTTPLCERGSESENMYSVTLIVSFAWVSLFSFVLSAVVQRWGKLTGVPLSFFGFALVALGAEIPDTVQSVTVARRGYGSMAVSNAIGSQILNICVGLGLPWTAALLAPGRVISVSDHREILVAVGLQTINVVCASAILLGVAYVMGQSKVQLKPSKGVFMVTMFFFIQTAYALFLFVPALNSLVPSSFS